MAINFSPAACTAKMQFTTPTGAPIDPTTVTLKFGVPGAETVLKYRTSVTVVRTGVGAYQAKVVLTSTTKQTMIIEWIGKGVCTFTGTMLVTIEPPPL